MFTYKKRNNNLRYNMSPYIMDGICITICTMISENILNYVKEKKINAEFVKTDDFFERILKETVFYYGEVRGYKSLLGKFEAFGFIWKWHCQLHIYNLSYTPKKTFKRKRKGKSFKDRKLLKKSLLTEKHFGI